MRRRIMISGPPPWAESGFGIQIAATGAALTSLGNQIAISAYAGVHEERTWNGMQILGTGGKPYGNGVIRGNYQRWNADLLLFLCDPWTIDPAQLEGLNVAVCMYVDCDPLSAMEQQWLDRAQALAASVMPIAMSGHARKMLADAGFPDAPVIPGAVQPEFYPDPSAGAAWQRRLGLPLEAFVIGKVGVSNEDDRKSFEVTLQAARFRKVYLYLHTEARAAKAPDLAIMAANLGLHGRVAFADQYKRGCDLYTAAEMAAMYNGLDALDAATKGEGFGVPIIEALACGTPVIGCRNSAVTEKISPDWGWLTWGQQTWARHHQAWWAQPSLTDLARAYDKAQTSARSMRKAAAAEGGRWTLEAMTRAWEQALQPAALAPREQTRAPDPMAATAATGP